MRVVETKETRGMNITEASVEQSPVSQTSYHELSDKPVRSVDAISQLHQNIVALDDLQERLAFVMREVRYQLKA